MRTLLLFSALFISVNQLFSQPAWPEITNTNKPWTRWWWEGSAVTKPDLTWAMGKYAQAGLGGMEITVIYGIKGQEDKFINYLSPAWVDVFKHTLNEGKRLGLGIDLANASGWPFGGPWVEPEDACKNINCKTYTLKAGETLAEPVEFVQKPLLRAGGVKPEFSQLVDPVGKSKNMQLYAIDQIRFEKKLPLVALMAYSETGKNINLTDKVEANGRLNWTAPEGLWTIYALFEGWHGKLVERAGPGGEGDVIDHFSEQAVIRYLTHFDEAFKGTDISALRGYFNDSYEVDDAQGQSNWTPKFFDEFKARRGYDLREHLTSLFGKDTTEKRVRILYDYRQTIADLLLEKYTLGWANWAHKQGKIIRNQSHGAPANILDLYAAADIPETEGENVLKLKFASSASNVTGKKLTSSESATWLGEHFQSTLSEAKGAIDQMFLGGVNHVFYHGTCYSPKDAPWPGWLFYASIEATPANSWWNDFSALNKYIAHVQSFLQNSKSDNDILMYFPISDRFSDPGRNMLEHFDGLGREFRGSTILKCSEKLDEKGFAFDYISDLQISKLENGSSTIKTGGVNYQILILPANKYIPIETFTKLISLAENGATILVVNNLPTQVPGFGNYESRQNTLNKLVDNLKFIEQANGIKLASIGKGRFVLGTNIEQMLASASVRNENLSTLGLKYTRRKTDKATIYFITNRSEKAFDGWLPLAVDSKSVALYNPMNEMLGIAKSRRAANGTTEVYAQIAAGESFIVEAYTDKLVAPAYPFYQTTGSAFEIEGKWDVQFTEGGPTLPKVSPVENLVSWTDFGGDEVKNFSGTVLYRIHFAKPARSAEAWELDLGKVCNSARIVLNGKEIATLIGPEFKTLITAKQLAADNTLEIKVSNLMANRIADLDRRNVDWKIFYNVNMSARLPQNRNEKGLFDASKWLPRESGLMGPVSLKAVEFVK